jgi:hypothetical protein
MKLAQSLAREKGDLERTNELRSSQVCAIGIEVSAPASQILGVNLGERALDCRAANRVKRRRLKQRFSQSAKVEACPAYDHNGASVAIRLADPSARLVRPPRC